MGRYYIAESETGMAAFFPGEGGLMWSSRKNGSWSRPGLFSGGDGDYFTVSCQGEDFYVVNQNREGDVEFKSLSGDKIFSQNIMKRPPGTEQNNILLYADIGNGGMNILYNASIPGETGFYLCVRRLEDDGSFGEVKIADKAQVLGKQLFNYYPLAENHGLVFYGQKAAENRLGYREIYNGRLGRYNEIHNTAYAITDYSCFALSDSLHVLYIVKTMFSTRLMYRKNDGGGFLPPVMILESQRIDSCLIFGVDDSINAAFMSGENLYIARSENRGESFKKPERYRNKFCSQPVKAHFIGGKNNSVRALEAYVDANRPWDIQLYPDIAEDFYPRPQARQEKPEIIREKGDSYKKPPREPYEAYSEDPYGFFNAAAENAFAAFEKSRQGIRENIMEDLPESGAVQPEDYRMLKNRYQLAQKSLGEKDAQLIQLAGLLKTQNTESLEIERTLRDKISALVEEKESIANKHAAVVEENTRLKMEMGSMKETISKKSESLGSRKKETLIPNEPEDATEPEMIHLEEKEESF